MPLPEIDPQFLLDFLTGLLSTPSPTGFTVDAVHYTETAFSAIPGLSMRRTNKGALLVTWPGESNDVPRGLTSHLDTLGAMVKEIKSNGRLKLTKIGGLPWNAVEGEGCTVITNKGKHIRGSFLLNQSSVHVYGKKVTENPRDEETMEVRLDERTNSSEDTGKLGIQVGDYVAFDPRVEVVNGFVRSRYLDDKACAACLLSALKTLQANGMKPKQTTYILLSIFEEVGHGASAGFPLDLDELLVVGMAAVGEGQNSDEFHASICVKDGNGPYHHGFSQRLRHLADDNQIDYKVDIYTHYGSDGATLLHAGADVKVGLIGPGVDASHNYERTHMDALLATTRWVMAYLIN